MTKTKNERITTLENEVAELKLIVHELRERPQLTTVVNNVTQGPSTTNTVEDIIEFEGAKYRKVVREAREGDVVIITKEHESSNAFKINKPYKVLRGVQIRSDHHDHGYTTYNVYTSVTSIRTPETVDVYELINYAQASTPKSIAEWDEKPKSTNQQRAAIIEKAKQFVENIVGEYDSFYTTIGKHKNQSVTPIFHVNEKKRAVTVLIYGAFSKRLIFKGIAKCNPSDVYNEHIGKAIALGRALGLDVSEFEQAVQPTIAVGQIVHSGMTIYEVLTLENIFGNVKYKDDNGYWQDAEGGYLPTETWYTIINDTNAKYEVF